MSLWRKAPDSCIYGCINVNVPLPPICKLSCLTVKDSHDVLRLQRALHLHKSITILHEHLSDCPVLSEETSDALLVSFLGEIAYIELCHDDCSLEGGEQVAIFDFPLS